ncbi:MAG: hypothetical protein ACJ780_04270 [Solirubrobacteraceae bacterium]
MAGARCFRLWPSRGSRVRVCALALVVGLSGLAASAAHADDWLPHPANATWQYVWSDSNYNPTGSVENVDVQQQSGSNFTLAWAGPDAPPPAASDPTLICPAGADAGTMSFQDTTQGLLNTNWSSCPPPASYPSGLLCAAGTGACPDSLAGFLYNVIWGNRAPVLTEPLLRGVTWSGSGGASNDVSSTSTYLGQRVVKVPAFPGGVQAAVVRTNLSLAGTLGDDYGSGVRTTWWVHGVGPVRTVFDHVDGSVTIGALRSTVLKPTPAPSDANYFPLQVGLTGTYRWTNRRDLHSAEVETVKVGAAAGSAARIDVKSVSGPIRAAGSYDFTSNQAGIRNTAGSTSAATVDKLPRLGHGRHFFTIVDLMTFGFNPLLPSDTAPGSVWRSGNARDLQVYGVTGVARIVGVRRVHVPAGTFQALEVRSVLTQHGYRYGSGVRTMWFAPGRGLVKLVFAHRDGSVSLVQLLR